MEPIIRAPGRETVMRRERAGDVEYLTFPLLSAQPGITHAFSTRRGGVSQGIYDSMNLSFTRGDDEEQVHQLDQYTSFTPANSPVPPDVPAAWVVAAVVSPDPAAGVVPAAPA